jgi:flagellar hook-length control protein FliK
MNIIPPHLQTPPPQAEPSQLNADNVDSTAAAARSQGFAAAMDDASAKPVRKPTSNKSSEGSAGGSQLPVAGNQAPPAAAAPPQAAPAANSATPAAASATVISAAAGAKPVSTTVLQTSPTGVGPVQVASLVDDDDAAAVSAAATSVQSAADAATDPGDSAADPSAGTTVRTAVQSTMQAGAALAAAAAKPAGGALGSTLPAGSVAENARMLAGNSGAISGQGAAMAVASPTVQDDVTAAVTVSRNAGAAVAQADLTAARNASSDGAPGPNAPGTIQANTVQGTAALASSVQVGAAPAIAAAASGAAAAIGVTAASGAMAANGATAQKPASGAVSQATAATDTPTAESGPDAATALGAATAAAVASAAQVITELASTTAADKHSRGGVDAASGPASTAAGDGTAGAAQAMAGTSSTASTDAAPQPTFKVGAGVDSSEFGQGVANQIASMVDGNISNAKLNVNPPALGPIEVRIAVQGDQAQVFMTSHSAVTRDALQASTPKLREMLGEQGFAQVSVDISQRSFQDRTPTAQSYEWNSSADRSYSAAASDPSSVTRAASGIVDAYA